MIYYLKAYTPNLGNMIIAMLYFIILLGMAVAESVKLYAVEQVRAYYVIVVLLSVHLLWIKTKYCFLDMFGIEEYVFKWAGKE